MKIGVDYYPEQWEKRYWERDAEIMARTGVKTVRIGDFMWSLIEKKEGSFDFSLLDEVIKIFARYTIKVVLCLPTSCPPLWLYEKYPEMIRTGMDGKKIQLGVRGHRCINSPMFRRHAKKLTNEMARHFAMNPSVAAWQVDNEMRAYQCSCDVCKEKFRTWLLNRHDSIEKLNRDFGNVVWGNQYSSEEQIMPPSDYPDSLQNPALCLEWYRFTSECTTDFIKEMMLVIKQYNPKALVTTNFAFTESTPNVYSVFKLLDFVSCNNYPPVCIPDEPDNYYSHAFYLDMMRGVKNNHFWVMEQLSGSTGGWTSMSPALKTGMLMGYSLQAMIHGADNIMHFRWRTATTGAEMFNHGIFDHNNVPNRRFYEFSELCKRAEQLNVLDSTMILCDIAILYSPECEKAFEIQPQTENFNYMQQLKAFHSAFTHLGANVDVIPSDADISSYKLVIAPSLFVANKKANENIYRYVMNGGTLVLTNRSGVKDENNNCIIDSLPTVFRELIGAEITEYNPVGYGTRTIRDFAGNEFVCTQWCDALRLITAKAYAEYSSGEYWSMPAVTLNRYCKGVAYYVGTVCSADFYESFASNLMMQTGIPKLKGLPKGVEVTTRTNGAEEYICFFNNSENTVYIPIPKPMYSVISSICRDRLELRPFEVDILRK